MLRTVKDLTVDQARNADYYVTKQVRNFRFIDLPVGSHTTTCMNCNWTCHRGCGYADNEEKAHCCAMGGNG